MLLFYQIKSIIYLICNLEAISSNYILVIISGHMVYLYVHNILLFNWSPTVGQILYTLLEILFEITEIINDLISRKLEIVTSKIF